MSIGGASCGPQAENTHDIMISEEIEMRMGEVARRYAETHDENIKAQLAELSRQPPASISNSQGGPISVWHSVSVKCRLQSSP